MIQYTPFAYLNADETAELRHCMCSINKIFKKGDIIMQLPNNKEYLCIVNSGIAHLIRIDINGTRSIIDYYEATDVFGAQFSPDTSEDTFYVIAKEMCSVSFVDYKKLLTRCKNNCEKHLRFLNNIILTAMEKSQIHIDVLSQRTIRTKILTYLKYLQIKTNSNNIILPLSLSDLADYLSTDRSAMMREIKKMNNEGLIQSNGNLIIVKNNEYGKTPTT